jgi:4-hydroxy-tetrahydrodipicolinate reductase
MEHPTRVGLIGYGKMGKELERLSDSFSLSIVEKFDIYNLLKNKDLSNIDVLIDFSAPSAALSHIEYAVAHNTPLVLGVTGWYDSLSVVQDIVAKGKGSVIYGSNFSIGMNILFTMTSLLSRLAYQSQIYDVSLHESHHRHKLDSPSGTAMSLSNIVLDEFKSKTVLCTESVNGRHILPHELHVSSQRMGSVIGEHTLSFDSDCDTITLSHSAKNRDGFARGALMAARWIVGKQGLYEFSDVFEEVIRV